MNTSEIQKMNTNERLQAMEAIWSALSHDETEIESPDWHGKILKERMKKVKDGSAKFISIEELRARS